MTNSFVYQSSYTFKPERNEEVLDSIFKQYERVIVESLLTSFGLNFIMQDQHGGDVDTIHNVRQMDIDSKMKYKNKSNQADYDNKGVYNSHEYHSHKNYIEKNRQVKKDKLDGQLYNSYTGENIKMNEKSDLDHMISAKETHDDRGRALTGLYGPDLANSPENLYATDPHTNRSKKADLMEEFLRKNGDKYSEEQKANMLKKDKIAREVYEKKLANAYYTSPKFAKDVAFAAGNTAMKMGVKEALGFVFTEVWFAVKLEFSNIKGDFSLKNMFNAIGKGIKNGFINAKIKYKDLLARVKDGAITGMISSLTTTLCNIFFTTSKNVVKIIRQTYSSIVQAAKIIFINPDNLYYGERMRAVVKLLATGASIVIGTLVSEALEKTPVGKIPIVGEIVQIFCGTLVTGIMSCTLLYFLDRSELMNKLVSALNQLEPLSRELNYYRQQAAYFEMYAAELMNIDINKFREDTVKFQDISMDLMEAKDQISLNKILINAQKKLGLNIPWEGDFDSFMSDKDARLIFK